MKCIGIDPGKNGAIVTLEGPHIVFKGVTPLIGNELDMHGLSELIRSQTGEDCHVFVEKVHAIHGSSAGATFTFGGVYYAVQAILCTLHQPFTLVQPKEWQKVMYQGIPEIRKAPIVIKKGKRSGQTIKGRVDTKAMSLLAAKRLYPSEDLRKNERSRIEHDGIVDALLIAAYGQRKLCGGF